MITFFQAGGFAMVFVLALGLATVAAAMAFFRSQETRHAQMTRALSLATVASSVAGVSAALGAVMTHVASTPEWANSPDMPLIVMTGVGESMAPPILGFSLLAIAWIVMAMGYRRDTA